MRRQEFITLVGAAAAWPVVAWAQQCGPMRRIGILMGGAKGDSQNDVGLAAFTDALKQLGWTDGHNIRIDIRRAAGNVERMTGLAKELVGFSPICSLGTPLSQSPRFSERPRQYQSCFSSCPIRSAADSLQAYRARAATSRGSSISRRH